MKFLPSVFSCLYSRVKIFVFAVNGRRHFSIFVWLFKEYKKKNEQSDWGSLCRSPSAVNVMLKLVRSRWLNIGVVLSWCEFMDFRSSVHKLVKKELGQYPTILTPHFSQWPISLSSNDRKHSYLGTRERFLSGRQIIPASCTRSELACVAVFSIFFQASGSRARARRQG